MFSFFPATLHVFTQGRADSYRLRNEKAVKAGEKQTKGQALFGRGAGENTG
ncbi:hypothetical protein [Trueperella sp. LYQ143]|uniref:hypothetical protein n=1 Tax=Trueperella sp. LYQ143 TaxID=3391059 RepID=UPI00398332F1